MDSHDAFAQSGLHRVLQTKDQRLVSTERDGYFGLSRITTEPLTVGSTIFVDLPERGISADFTVREIRPCPTPMAGDGYLVTTKFIHENAEILDLRIEGSREPIGTTASHPFWSEDRQQFVAAGELRVGENLLIADDTTRRVESITLRPNRETVYNIKVDGEHVFYVGEDGVLVHNTCPKPVIRGMYDFYPGSGQWAHSRFVKWLTQRYGVSISANNLRQGLTGIDLKLRNTLRGLREAFGNPSGGFRYVELKPLSASGRASFLEQIKRWRAKGQLGNNPNSNVGLFTYYFDEAGLPVFEFWGTYN